MNRVGDVLAGMGFLIAIYLFLFKGDETVKIITAMANATTSGVKALQGRDN